MMFPELTASEKRSDLRKKLKSGKLLVFPGAFSPLVAMLIEQKNSMVSTYQVLYYQMIWDTQISG